jgi:prevent-host-death family protein
MTIKVTATQAKAKILALLDDVSAGEEVEITRHGRVVARLVPATASHALKGSMRGIARTATKREEDLFSTGARWKIQ